LIRRHAQEISDDVLILARQAREGGGGEES
jgi:hypothetical protein